MQNKQKKAISRKIDDFTNLAPRQKPPMVTRILVGFEGTMKGAGEGILHHPPRYAR